MKKILSLVLAVVMIMAMTVPAFAATENEITPCAACTGSHTPGTFQSYDYDYRYGNATTCNKVKIAFYECSVCHKIFEYSVTVIAVDNHTPEKTSATCDGTTQKVRWTCSKCGGFVKYTYQNCPNAGHSGSCQWLPV